MNKSSKLLIVIVTVFLLASSLQVECRRTYSSRSSSSGRGNRGKNQPSSGFFSSWFGGSKSSGSSSGSVSHSKPSSTSAKKNWQTASSQASSQSKSGWANPYYKPAGSAVPSAPKADTNYGWKPALGSPNKAGSSSLPSSNIGSRGYPVQSGVQQASQSNYAGFKPAPSAPNAHSTNFQPSQSGFGGYHPAPSLPNTHNTHFQSSGAHAPSYSSNVGGYHPAPSVPNTAYKPSNTYQPSNAYQPSNSYQPSHGYQSSYNAHPPSYNAPSYHPSPSHYGSSYPQQPHYSAPSYSGYPVHSTFGSSAPTYQGNKLFGGSSGHYGYPGSGSWGLDSYGAKRSSGTGKLLTGLAVGAAGGYLTSSLVNSISNPWKYSGYGYGSRFGYGSDLGSSYGYVTRDQSAFERGYERGVRDRNENNKETPAPAAPAPAPEPEDPTSKWIHCVAFDPQTQQTLINPNCSCTVTTSLDERTGQPLSVHHCTTLNGLVMKPIPIGANGQPQPVNAYNGQPPFGVNGAQPNGQPGFGVNEQPPSGVNGPPTGVNAPGAVPSYGSAYEGSSQYGAGSAVYLPFPGETKKDETVSVKSEGSTVEAIAEKSTKETKTEESTTEGKTVEGTTGTVIKPEVISVGSASKVEGSMGGTETSGPQKLIEGGNSGSNKTTAEFFGQLQKIVNMGSFVDGG